MEDSKQLEGSAGFSADVRNKRVHRPVLLREAIEMLRCRDGGFFVDCTLGMGGHAEEILKGSAPGGTLLAFDRDEQAIRTSIERLSGYGNRFHTVHEDYRNLPQILAQQELSSPDGILADLGPSLLQFTSAERGFSFQLEGPLDMRMDQRQLTTAEQIVNHADYAELFSILKEFGEEPAAGRIARRVIEARQQQPIRTTTQLRQIVESARPRKREDKIHPATQTFQALRIAVNRELEDLDTFVFDAFDALAVGGRLVLITFHSLEDRIVKHAFQFLSAACRCPKRQVECRCGGKPLSILLTRKPVLPAEKEIAENPASRSAKLRAVEKQLGPAPRNLWRDWRNERT